jgi:phenol 2-monooxygenase (NADPH)
MFSGQIGAVDEAINSLTHEQFLKVFSDGSGFTSGCGIEYPTSLLVQACDDVKNYPVTGKDYLQGALKPGRRLLDVVVRQYADANIRHLQDGTAAPSVVVQVLLADNNLFSRFPIYRTLSSSRPCKQ